MNYKNNTFLISIISILFTIAVVLVILCMFLLFNKTPDNNQPIPLQTETSTQTSAQIPEEPTEVQPTTMYVANVADSIYLRSEPEEKSKNIITTIPLGAQVVWICDETPIFSKVSYGGNTGYVKRDYLSTTQHQTQHTYTAYTTNTKIDKYVYVSNVKNSIYLRSTIEETPNNIITTIPLGTEVGFIEYASNDFSKINYNGIIGYAKTMYLSDYYDHTYQYMTVCNVKNSIYLRSTPYENQDNIICEIPVNSVVRFIENANGGFYKIAWDGYVGYSKSKYLR